MAHFPELDSNNNVLRVIKVDNNVINNASGLLGENDGVAFCKSLFGEDTIWKQTSYNTRGGIHYDSNKNPDSETAIRGNHAESGMIYDSTLDAFYFPTALYPSWTFNKTTFKWEAPVAYPTDELIYEWDETTRTWVAPINPVSIAVNAHITRVKSTR
jgi:hypothetical protein